MSRRVKMPEITDDIIKARHKEFDEHIRVVLTELSSKATKPDLTRIREAFAAKKLPTVRKGR